MIGTERHAVDPALADEEWVAQPQAAGPIPEDDSVAVALGEACGEQRPARVKGDALDSALVDSQYTTSPGASHGIPHDQTAAVPGIPRDQGPSVGAECYAIHP